MRFISTRSDSVNSAQTLTSKIGFAEALAHGLASDGGLYVPDHFPHLDWHQAPDTTDLPAFAAFVLQPFFSGPELSADDAKLARELDAICRSALNFPIPLRSLREGTSVLELFHGPTAAFKDVGARFLAECVSRLAPANTRNTVIVATSGDTGGAVAGAFHGRPGFEVMILYPKGKISARQEKQLTCWGGNIQAFAVRGTFDDCQRIVKEALSDREWRAKRNFISANSISVGRLLPQMVYYARASVEHMRRTGRAPGFIVPTGNLGNAVAALWAKRIGFPIAQVVLATNANRPITEYFASGQWQPHPTVATLANAMDVGNPSNIERLRHLYPDFKDLTRDVHTLSVTDEQIRDTIRRGPKEWGEIWCPHTATAVVARERLQQTSKNGGFASDWILVATAHPAKFETIVEPLIGKLVEIPPALAALLDREPVFTEIEAGLASFKTHVN
jgi:threonine synthase